MARAEVCGPVALMGPMGRGTVGRDSLLMVPGGGPDLEPSGALGPALEVVRSAGSMQQMQSLQLTPRGRCPTSPNAAKRLYRNLSDKLRGSTSSFEDTYFFGKSDRLRKASVSHTDGALRALRYVLWSGANQVPGVSRQLHQSQISSAFWR
ncbi:hypothetical protein WMY93_009828 [Mugilogobius chulae]|uniref:Uncharacterized protein n=1 Tax=Mugilogobius chulae TaxID=88201 RepID=A0AAW0PEI0_9GOBI